MAPLRGYECVQDSYLRPLNPTPPGLWTEKRMIRKQAQEQSFNSLAPALPTNDCGPFQRSKTGATRFDKTTSIHAQGVFGGFAEMPQSVGGGST